MNSLATARQLHRQDSALDLVPLDMSKRGFEFRLPPVSPAERAAVARVHGRDKARYEAPALGKGQIEYVWSADLEVEIVCHLEYSAAEEAEPYGDAPYPGSPECITLCAAYVRGVDISPLLSKGQIAFIEERALLERSES